MKLIPWNFERKPALSHDFDSFFNGFFNGSPWQSDAWLPRLDVSESEDAVEVKADLPGLDKKDIEVSLENGVLTLSGERRQEEEKESGGWQRVERSYGNFRRSVSLPSGVDASQVKADYKDGVLTVRIAKSESAKPKTININ